MVKKSGHWKLQGKKGAAVICAKLLVDFFHFIVKTDAGEF